MKKKLKTMKFHPYQYINVSLAQFDELIQIQSTEKIQEVEQNLILASWPKYLFCKFAVWISTNTQFQLDNT
jgi:hypothetical protein